MNHVYRVIWNRSAACWQAVSETARGQSKSSKSTTTLLKPLLVAASMAVSGIAVAAPTGGVVTSGTASIGVSGSTTTINQSTAKAIINWNDFSIASGETVNFVQPDANAIALNRVVTATPSSIQGALNANGQVFIVNPNGITFGSTAQVNVGGLVASTLDISDSDFNNGTYRFANSSNNASITNQGAISVANSGTAALIAPSIQQAGSIVNNDGSILLTAASDVSLSLTNRVLNSQTINAGHNSATINHSAGSIQADGGKVILTAQGVNSSSTASISSAGSIRAQTLSGNDRGAIDLIADSASGTVNLTGTLDASAPTNGFGGTIRTIGADVAVANSASVTTRKVNQTNLPGTSSYWLIRANSINVGSGGTISGSELSSSLNDGSVTLSAAGTASNQGTLNINDAVSSNSNVIFGLAANKDINFNNNVGLTANLGRLVMSYGSSNDYNLNNNSKITLSGAGATLRLNSTDYTIINSLGVAGDTTTTTLQGMKNNLTGNYALGSDIDASATSGWNGGAGFESIGQVVMDVGGNPFTGSFHGLGHTVDGLTINTHETVAIDLSESGVLADFPGMSSAYTPQGLFSVALGNLRDINLANTEINGAIHVGALVGYHAEGIIKNAHSSGNIHGLRFVGGLIGTAGYSTTSVASGKITDSSSSATVKGIQVVGGLVGEAVNPVYNSYATGDISVANITMATEDVPNITLSQVSGFFGGGLVGSGSGIYNSYATGAILKGTYINGDWHSDIGFNAAGGLAGAVRQVDNHFIDHSYATGNIDGYGALGGLVGETGERDTGNSERLFITNSYATGNITGTENIGGLVGANAKNNIIENTYSTGNVTGTNYVGGLLGNNNGGIIRNSYSTSSVSGSDAVGGLVGLQTGYAVANVENSYSVGTVSGTTNTGGLIGQLDVGTVTSSYWNTTTSGQSTSDGGTGKTTAQLKQIATFTGWDIADVSNTSSTSTWVIDENNATPWLR